MPKFELDAAFSPAADQPAAIRSLAEGVESGERSLTPLGATGTGKTMAMAGVVEAVQKPALVIARNKTLAAQLCNEFRTYFPHNAVEYFVSYYDYYQPEAYVPSRTSTSRRTRPSTRRSTGCATRPQRRCSPGATC